MDQNKPNIAEIIAGCIDADVVAVRLLDAGWIDGEAVELLVAQHIALALRQVVTAADEILDPADADVVREIADTVYGSKLWPDQAVLTGLERANTRELLLELIAEELQDRTER